MLEEYWKSLPVSTTGVRWVSLFRSSPSVFCAALLLTNNLSFSLLILMHRPVKSTCNLYLSRCCLTHCQNSALHFRFQQLQSLLLSYPNSVSLLAIEFPLILCPLTFWGLPELRGGFLPLQLCHLISPTAFFSPYICPSNNCIIVRCY